MQVHHDRYVLGEEFVGRGAFVEIERLAFAQNLDARHGDFDQRGIKFDASAAGRREDASPVGITTGECGFYQRRGGDGFRYFARSGLGASSAHFNFDYALSAFAVRDDLLGERAAHSFQRGRKLLVRFAALGDLRCASGAVGEDQ